MRFNQSGLGNPVVSASPSALSAVITAHTQQQEMLSCFLEEQGSNSPSTAHSSLCPSPLLLPTSNPAGTQDREHHHTALISLGDSLNDFLRR